MFKSTMQCKNDILSTDQNASLTLCQKYMKVWHERIAYTVREEEYDVRWICIFGIGERAACVFG